MNTILNALDQQGVDERMLSASVAMITFCRACGHVDDVPEARKNHPCKTCGRDCNTRTILFGGEEGDLLAMVLECYRSRYSRPACVLLFCALMELHLRMLILRRWRWLRIEWPDLGTTMKEKWKFEQRVELFKSLTGVSLDRLELTHPLFSRYKEMISKRHNLAHGLTGATWAVTEAEIRSAVESAAESFSVFARVHHQYCSVDSAPLPLV